MSINQVTVYHLEMLAPSDRFVPAPREGLTVLHVQAPSVPYYRSLYNAVGEDFHWRDRRMMSDEALAAILGDSRIELHALHVDGAVAGFAELDRRQPDEIQLVQFGLIRDFIGQGLGKWFLQWTIDKAWSYEPKRFWLHTCTQDHAAALPNYRKAGFVQFKQESTRREPPGRFQAMSILFLHGWRSIPGGVKPTFLKDHGYQVINPALDDEDFDRALATAQEDFDQHMPAIVVGSSRGGALAMNIDSGEARLVLLCPAWRNWGTVKTVKPGAVILHSRADDVIPFADSEELVGNSGLPPSALIEVGHDHRLADPAPLAAMLKACQSQMKPITFACTDTIPLAPQDIARQILDVAKWSDFRGYGPIPGSRCFSDGLSLDT